MNGKWYKTTSSIRGPLLVVEDVENVSYGEICKVRGEGEFLGQVLDVSESRAVLQLFENSTGLDLSSKVKFTGKTAEVGVGDNMLGNIFDGLGRCTSDNTYTPEKYLDVNGAALNPAARKSPSEFVETGMPVIDTMTTLVRGQKLPVFSESGLPHNELAARIVNDSNIHGEDFVVVFAAIGVTNEEKNYFLDSFKKNGAMENTVCFINTADDPSVERVMTPRVALSAAEYLAWEKEKHVLVVMSDITNYCESLREISSSRNEIPGRRGYPGYMYTDLASLYERCGVVQGVQGSVTQIPILSMPSGDRTHPVPDLTGYITEGQIYLDKSLSGKSVNPPVNPLKSLSRLMGNVMDKTREDHKALKDQLYASYARGVEVRQVSAVVGEESLSEEDKAHLDFASKFEKEFISQSERKKIVESLDKAWWLLSLLPVKDLKKLKKPMIDKYMSGK